uniref:beta-N-acetylhexosaminidase n=1 Tax=Panagrellus redivivus TaxID=6233 RepID=A0A7E4VXG6_PANRE
MVTFLRGVRRFFRVTPRSCFTNLLYASAALFTVTLVASQLSQDSVDNDNQNPQFDLHKPLQKLHDEQIRGLSANAAAEPASQRVLAAPAAATNDDLIAGQVYPKLVRNNFVPLNKIIHLDLKGAPYKPTFYNELFTFFNRLGLTGVLIEWEDMFPYTGKLADAINGNHYSMADIESILQSAKSHRLEVIPLVQTFGHLEWILKLPEFMELREDKRYPQVICFAADEAFKLIKQMVDEVAAVHKKFGMKRFHMGADEAFQVGFCNATLKRMAIDGSKERTILWHIARTAHYIKDTHNVDVLAWHDMFAHANGQDLRYYKMTDVIEPVLWSYAEDLDSYLPFSAWLALKPFKRVWGSSAIKGADGPMQYRSNPMHYIKNHESWVTQMNRAYQEFEVFEGLIITGWSRYDHLAIMTELLPVNLPTLAMSIETLNEARPLHGSYPWSTEMLQCDAKYEPGYVYGCRFPGRRVYELVNELFSQKTQFKKYIDSDYEFNGWLSVVARDYNFSSPMYVEKINQFVEYHLNPFERLETSLRQELAVIYFEDTVDEFILTYVSAELELLRKSAATIERIRQVGKFARRPFVKYPASKKTQEL